MIARNILYTPGDHHLWTHALLYIFWICVMSYPIVSQQSLVNTIRLNVDPPWFFLVLFLYAFHGVYIVWTFQHKVYRVPVFESMQPLGRGIPKFKNK
jgi:hypothetical protein